MGAKLDRFPHPKTTVSLNTAVAAVAAGTGEPELVGVTFMGLRTAPACPYPVAVQSSMQEFRMVPVQMKKPPPFTSTFVLPAQHVKKREDTIVVTVGNSAYTAPPNEVSI
jgi:hypothetical protein